MKCCPHLCIINRLTDLFHQASLVLGNIPTSRELTIVQVFRYFKTYNFQSPVILICNQVYISIVPYLHHFIRSLLSNLCRYFIYLYKLLTSLFSTTCLKQVTEPSRQCILLLVQAMYQFKRRYLKLLYSRHVCLNGKIGCPARAASHIFVQIYILENTNLYFNCQNCSHQFHIILSTLALYYWMLILITLTRFVIYLIVLL